MKCLNRIEVQEYMDNEVGKDMAEEISRHIETCKDCEALLSRATTDKKIVNSLLNQSDKKEKEAGIPEFKRPAIYTNKRSIYRLIPYLLAASLLIFIVLIRFERTPVAEKIPEAELLLYDYYDGKDLNKMWHERAQIIILQDEKGNIIEPIITN